MLEGDGSRERCPGDTSECLPEATAKEKAARGIFVHVELALPRIV
jgi:hypothetical protein